MEPILTEKPVNHAERVLGWKPAHRVCGPRADESAERFENWVARRALCRPTFLRSTSRASRVMKPAVRSSPLSDSSYSTSARAMPRRIAPAWPVVPPPLAVTKMRSEEHTSELQSLMRISYAVFCLKKKNVKDSHVTH